MREFAVGVSEVCSGSGWVEARSRVGEDARDVLVSTYLDVHSPKFGP